MPAAQGIRAGKAYVELGVSNASLVRGLRSAERKLKAFGGSVRQIGAKLTGLGGLLAAPLATSVKIFAGFADKMSEVRAVTGASNDQFAKLEATAKQLGSTTSFTASQVADGMKYLGMAGFNTEQILAGIPAVLNLARAGAIELGMAADIASDVGSAFGLAADEIGHIADVMAVTASSANTNIEMMGETLKYAAPLAKAAGQSLEDTATAIGIMGNSGIKASMAGTDLALIMKKMGSEARQALGKMGVQSVDAEGNVRSVLDVMKELGDATRDMSESQRLKFFADTFDRAAKSAIILSDGGKPMDDLRAKIGKADDAAADMAATMDDNVGGAFRQFMSAVEGIAIAIGESLAPTIREWASGLTNIAGIVTRVVTQNRELFAAIAKGVAITIAVGAALMTVGIAISGLGAVMGMTATAITGVGAVLGTIGTLLGALLSPIGLVVAGVAGLATWILTATETGSQALSWLGSQFEALKNTAITAWQGIGDALAAGDISLAAKILWLSLKMEWKKGVHALNQVWVKMKEFFLSTWTEAVFGAAKIATNAWAGLQAGWTETVDFLRDTWTIFTTFLAKNWNRVVGFIKGAWQKLKSAVTGKDTSAVQKQIEAETARQNEELDAKRNQDIAAREQSRKQRLSEIESARTGTLSELDSQREADHVARQKAFASDLAGTEAALEEAKKEWQAAVEEAAKANKPSEGGEGENAPGPQSPLPQLQQRLQGAGTAIANARQSLAAVDASSSEGLALFAAASRGSRLSSEDQMAKNTEKIVEEQKKANTTLERIERKTQTPKVAKLSG